MTIESRRPRRQTGENRRRLLEAGLIEFGLHGFYGASTASIALRADVPQPHLYANFESKQQLFLACVEHAFDIIIEAVEFDRTPHDDVLRVLYQAYASLGHAELRMPLSEALRPLRSMVSAETFAGYLRSAADSY